MSDLAPDLGAMSAAAIVTRALFFQQSALGVFVPKTAPPAIRRFKTRLVDLYSAEVARCFGELERRCICVACRSDGECCETSLVDFVRSNAENPGLCREVASLGPGESVEAGGGAAPVCRVERTS